MVGTSLPIAGYADHHQVRVHRRKCVPAQSPGFHLTGAEILDDNIRISDQFLYDILGLRGFQVEG
ncbi:hypothetical protein D3C80_851630 [compost metagenome]